MKLTYIIIFVLAIVFSFTACTKDEEPEIEKKINIDAKSAELIKADNEFGLDIFQRIYADKETPENFMISPLSISMALSMAYNGAETTTKNEMEKTLLLKGLSREEVNQSYKAIVKALVTADPKVVMEVANSVWYRNNYFIQQSFLDVNTNFYDAEVNPSDFDNPETVTIINNWVSDKTHNKIETIIDRINPETVLFLINAIYFNGTWTKEFNKESTQDLAFKNEKGSYILTPFMGRKDSLDFFTNDTFSAIKLPYGDGNFSMTVLLPNDGKDVSDIISQFNPSNWNKWQSGFKHTNNIDIRIPKFKVEFEIKLNSILQAMGMPGAFTPAADFSGINPARDLYISFVRHKTFIDVHEEGTEAAAVTIIGFDRTSAEPSEPQWIPFHCVKPFLYAITEKDTEAILFMGKVGDPTVKND
jgi:serine protease inhibitor